MKGNLGLLLFHFVVWEIELSLVILKHVLVILNLVVGSYQIKLRTKTRIWSLNRGLLWIRDLRLILILHSKNLRRLFERIYPIVYAIICIRFEFFHISWFWENILCRRYTLYFLLYMWFPDFTWTGAIKGGYFPWTCFLFKPSFAGKRNTTFLEIWVTSLNKIKYNDSQLHQGMIL